MMFLNQLLSLVKANISLGEIVNSPMSKREALLVIRVGRIPLVFAVQENNLLKQIPGWFSFFSPLTHGIVKDIANVQEGVRLGTNRREHGEYFPIVPKAD